MLGKKVLTTGHHVNIGLAKRSREAIGGLVPQAGSDRKSTKSRKVQFRLPPFKKHKTIALEQDHDDFQLWP